MEDKLKKKELLTKMEEWFEGLYEYGNEEDKQAYQQIVALIKKPKVTGEFIEKLVSGHWNSNWGEIFTQEWLTDFVKLMFKKAGVEVVQQR